ncbi:MAG TPA: hypothetical protein VKA26_08395 [Ignavibacteriaceae bacterium]|nr:hypothetical protein [Ignavibacteriaceae bacterium]
MPIIKASLGIFALISFISVVVSYIIYKIKSRNRTKPYEVNNNVNKGPIIFNLQKEMAKNKRFEILNDNRELLNQIANSNEPVLRKLKATSGSKTENKIIQPERKSENGTFNIYDLYTNNRSSSMHKLRLKQASSE